MCSLNSQISPASKNRAPIHHESAKSLRPGQSLISSPRHENCDVFFAGNVFNVIGSGLSDVRSGTSMTTCCAVNANMDPGDLGNQIVYWLRVNGLELSKWMSVYKMFAFTMRHVVFEVPESTLDSPEPITSKTFAHKKHIAIPMTMEGDKRLTWP